MDAGRATALESAPPFSPSTMISPCAMRASTAGYNGSNADSNTDNNSMPKPSRRGRTRHFPPLPHHGPENGPRMVYGSEGVPCFYVPDMPGDKPV